MQKQGTDPDEPTPQEIEEVIRKADLQFDGAPLTEEDKEDIIGFIRVALKAIKRKREQQEDGQAPDSLGGETSDR